IMTGAGRESFSATLLTATSGTKTLHPLNAASVDDDHIYRNLGPYTIVDGVYYVYYQRDGVWYRKRILDPNKKGKVEGVEGLGIIYVDNLGAEECGGDGPPGPKTEEDTSLIEDIIEVVADVAV